MLRENLPEILLDIGLIDQALTNVLENAARFTPPGRRSRWERRAGGRRPDPDRGPGPRDPAEERERVLEPFVRGEGRRAPGSGSRSPARSWTAHGGTIQVADEPGGGAAIVLELPGSD